MCGDVCICACVVVCVCVCVVRLHECILMLTYSIPPTTGTPETRKEQADECPQSYQSLDAGLGSMEEARGKDEPIHSEVEVVKQQVEVHKVRVAASSSNCFCPSSIPISVKYHTILYRSSCFSVGSNIYEKNKSSLIPTLRSENLDDVSTEYFSLWQK